MANSLQTPLPTLAPELAAPQVQERLRPQILSVRLEPFLVLGLMVLGLVAHGFNMFNYPAFTFLDDEGLITGQATAVLYGHLTPYTYIYENAPAGWVMLAGWLGISGGLHAFGDVIDSGRVLMLLLHLASIPLLYRITRKLGGNVTIAAFATLLFSLSPLAIFYQRLVLLDNMMIFWLLASLNLLLDGWGRLSRVVTSGACFGIAVLTKESALILLPAFVFIAMQQRWKHQGRFSLIGWLWPMIIITSWYPLYALLKGELFPGNPSIFAPGSALGQVSLWDTVWWKLTREGGGLLNYDNQFWTLVRKDWFGRDGLLLAGGAVAVIVNLRRGFQDRRALAAGLLGLLPLLYLARGGTVLNYQIVFALPFLALNLALVLEPLRARLHIPARLVAPAAALALLAVAGNYWLSGELKPLYNEVPAQAGREALAWIKANLPAESRLIVRDDLWSDLREAGSGGPAFPNAHPHLKIASDREVREGVFKNNWQTVDYLVITPNLEKDFQLANNTLALDALHHAHLVKRWTAQPGTTEMHPQQIIELWKVDKPGPLDTALLVDSASYITRRFEQNGALLDADRYASSEEQSYALLQAVWSGDRAGFERIWGWTRTNLLNKDGLLAWQWQDGKIVRPQTLAGADSDTALALLMAGKRWNDPTLLEAGQKMAGAIWQHEVIQIKGQPYLAAGDWATQSGTAAVNPSYFAPYAYRVFVEADPGHDWRGLIDTGYRLLFDVSAAPLGGAKSAGLPPDWIGLDRTTGAFVPLKITQDNPTRYGYEAPRTYWRIALDERWSGDGRAKAYLSQAGFLRDEITQVLKDGQTRKNSVSAVYEHDGRVVIEASSLVGTTGAVAALLTLDPATANTLYAARIVGGFSRTEGGIYWGEPSDLYAQQWGWFGAALYTNALPDLWHIPAPAQTTTGGNK